MQYQQHLPPGKMAPDWVHLNIAELKKFIGIAIVNGIHRAPRINLLWSNSPVFHNPLVASAMTYKRFETILRFLHLSNNERGQPTDTIWKVRPLLDTLNQIFQSNWNCGREISIDEMDAAFKGRHHLKERITYKKAGDGFLIYALCDQGYTYSFLVKCDKKWPRKVQGLTSTFSVVLNLVMKLPTNEKWHHLFVDNLYSNVKMAQILFDKNVLLTCTARDNRIPEIVKIPNNAPSNSFSAAKKGSVLALTWKDRKVVKFITTGHSSPQLITIQKKKTLTAPDGTKTRVCMNIETLNVARDYNFNMNGVDIADQLRGNYSTKLRSRKWWHVFFWWALDTSICNAYTMYVEHSSEPMTHLKFREKLALQLLGEEHPSNTPPSKGRKRSMSMSPVKARVPANHHFPTRVEKNEQGQWLPRECVHCKEKGVRKRSTYECSACSIGLCIECFVPFHQNDE